jgi:HEAT repeat protein
MSAPTEIIVPLLAKRAFDAKIPTNLRREAVFLIGNQKPTLASLKQIYKAMEDPNPDVREQAADSHFDIARQIDRLVGGPPKPRHPDLGGSIKALSRALKDPIPKVRASAAYGLGLLKRAGADGLNALCAALKDPEEVVRNAAAEALGWSTQEEALPALLEAVQDGNEKALEAMCAVVRWGLDHNDAAIERIAARMVPQIEKSLEKKLKNKSPLNNEVYVLRVFKAHARAAVPLLLRILRTATRQEDQIRCAYALADIGGVEARKSMDVLKDKVDADSEWRKTVAYCTGRLGKPGRELDRILVKMLSDQTDLYVRGEAAKSAGMLTVGPEVVRKLEAVSRNDPEEDVRRQATQALEHCRQREKQKSDF